MGLLADLKHEILRLLKEDEEFRLAVAGLIGLGEILRRLDRHEEELKKLREDFLAFVKEQEKRWEENNRRWEENNKRWEENNRRWEENNKRWKENEKRWEENRRLWEENFKRWEENNRRWEENNRRWEEAYKRFEAIESELKKLREDFNRFVELEEKRWEEANRRFSRIELELGVLTESTYSRYVWEDLREEIRSRGEAVLTRRRNAEVDGVEIDLLIETDRSVYVIEVKIKPSIGDVGSLIAKTEVVEKKLRKQAIPILAGALIGDDVRVYAESKGVTVYSY